MCQYCKRRVLDETTCRKIAKQYKSRADLAKNDSAVYRKCINLNILDELLPRQLKKYNEQECVAIASKYKFPWELGKANNAVYQMLQHHGMLEKLYPLHRNKKYNDSECIEIAKQYGYPGDLRKDFPAVYQALYKRKLIKQLFPNTKYNHPDYERCRLAASKFHRKKDFMEKLPSEYEKSIRMGWVDDFAKEFNYCSFRESQMESRIANGISISNDEIISIAHKYTDRSKFIKESGVYGLAQKRGLLPFFTWMKQKPQGWEDVVYAYEFPNTKVAYIGRTGRPEKRDYEHKNLASDNVFKYAKSQGLQVPKPIILHKGLSLNAGKQLECLEIENYKNNGWSLLNRRPGGGAGNIGYSISKTYALKIAKRYDTLKQLREDYPKIVCLLYSKGWIAECTWLKRIRPPMVKRGHWDIYDNVKAEALKYKTESEFKSKAWGAYDGSIRNGWLNELFQNAV